MADDAQITELLTRAADSLGPVAPPPLARFTRRRRRGTIITVLAPIGAVILVVALAVVLRGRSTPSQRAAHPPPGPPPATHSPVGVGVPTLQTYRWQAIPHAPIAARYDEAAVWTGKQLLVWGGTTGNDELADGATYDPKTRTWDRLPKSPLAGRVGPAYAWTGSKLFVWGDTDDRTTVADGATYDPASHRWTKVPPAPVDNSYRYAYAFAVRSTVVLLTTSPDRADTVEAAAYDQSGNTWSKLPTLHLPTNHDIEQLVGLVAGNRLLVWSEWAHVVAVHNGSDTTPGVDSFTFRLDAKRWSMNRLVPTGRKEVRDPIWTGRDVVIPSQDIWCGACSHPMSYTRTGSVIDPTTGKTSVIPAVPDIGSFVWTGAALVGVGAKTAAWTPTTDVWTTLPDAPAQSEEGVVVWTGSSVLVWGQPSDGSKREVGLEFGPR